MQRVNKWGILLNIENQRLSKGLPHFYDEIELEALRVDKYIQDFDKLYQEHVK